MVSLTELYNIKESTFSELKKNRDPARGNKGKNREKGFKLVSKGIDPETGKDTSDVVYEKSMSNMFKDLYAEAQDFETLAKENSNDTFISKMSEELTEMVNDFRTHLKNNYPEEHLKLDEANVTGTGASISTGNSPAYATPQVNPNMMMQQQNMMGPGKDFNQVFKAERENYEILNYQFHLEDVEDAFIAKYKRKK